MWAAFRVQEVRNWRLDRRHGEENRGEGCRTIVTHDSDVNRSMTWRRRFDTSSRDDVEKAVLENSAPSEGALVTWTLFLPWISDTCEPRVYGGRRGVRRRMSDARLCSTHGGKGCGMVPAAYMSSVRKRTKRRRSTRESIRQGTRSRRRTAAGDYGCVGVLMQPWWQCWLSVGVWFRVAEGVHTIKVARGRMADSTYGSGDGTFLPPPWQRCSA